MDQHHQINYDSHISEYLHGIYLLSSLEDLQLAERPPPKKKYLYVVEGKGFYSTLQKLQNLTLLVVGC